MTDKFARQMFDTCKQHVKGSRWEYLISAESESPKVKERLKTNLQTWDQIWDETIKNKYGSSK